MINGLSLKNLGRLIMDKLSSNGVFVFIEQRDGIIQKVSLELLGKARELADQLETYVTAVVIGHHIVDECEKMIWFGADHILYSDHSIYKEYITEPYTKVLTSIIKEYTPEIFLFGATAIGRDLAPRISARIHTGLTADCTRLEIDEETKNLFMTRPAFGGNIMATIVCPEFRPQMATVRPGVMQAMEEDKERKGTIKPFNIQLSEDSLNIEIVNIVKDEKKKISIEEAKILISGGRGVANKENFQKLFELADLMDAEVSASRAVVDSGWQDRERQVGQTGKTVRPDLYIACGISGAIQHVAGMEQSELIVAINSNEEAPIFEVADVGIVNDLNVVLPKLTDALKKRINN